MRFTRYDDVREFSDVASGVLGSAEARNSVLLGIAARGARDGAGHGWRDASQWFMATVGDEGGVRLAALMTPPQKLLLGGAEGAEAALPGLIDGLREAGVHVPGVTAEASLAEAFARGWAAATGVRPVVAVRQRIYELTSVNPKIPEIGSLRAARETDLAFLPFWMDAFSVDCGLSAPGPMGADLAACRQLLAEAELYVLEVDGTPVSMAQRKRPLAHTCSVSYVYTPPYFRGHGYASAAVAALSRTLLAEGFAGCVLYTDLANPISNSIYQRIGYHPVCDSLELRFEP